MFNAHDLPVRGFVQRVVFGDSEDLVILDPSPAASRELVPWVGAVLVELLLTGDRVCAFSQRAWQEFGFDDIVEAAIVVDGETVTRTSGSRSLTGAVVGGVLFGPAGAVVGGLGVSTQSCSQEQVTQVDLVIVMNDFARPCRAVHFMHYRPFMAVMSSSVEAKQNASEWLARLRTIMAADGSPAPTVTQLTQ